MMRSHFVATAIAAIATTTAADAQTGLFGQMLKALAKPAGETGSAPARSASSAPLAAVPPTAAQTAAIHQKLAAVQVTQAVRQDLTDALPIIEPTVTTIACATDAIAFRALNARRLKPQNYGSLDYTFNLTAMGAMHYHDRRGCVDLNRVTSVSKPALNELVVGLSFVSATSGEAKGAIISFRKMGNDWLLDQLSSADF